MLMPGHQNKQHEKHPSTMRWRYPLFLLVTVLIGVEVVLRAFDPIGIVYLYDVRRYFKTMLIDDDRYAYIHAANTQNTLNGEAVRFNNIGLRGADISLQKPENSTRLMILGDSVVLGWGVSEQARFTSKLQDLFNRSAYPADIVAAGVGSWNTRTEYEFLRHVGIKYDPDILLLLIVPNDTDPKRDSGYTAVPRDELFPKKEKQDRSLMANWAEDFWRSAARTSYVAAYLKYFWLEYLDNGAGTPVNSNSPQWRDAQLALDGIINLTRDREIKLIVYLLGSKETIASNPVLMLYDQHLKARGIAPQLFPKHLIQQRKLHISMVDSHFNNEGNQLVAETLFQYLAPLLEKSK